MKNQGFIKTRSFGVWLGKATDGGSGEITFGGFNPTHIVGSLTTIPLVRSFDSTGIWVVQLSKLSINGKDIALAPANSLAIVDTGTSVILAPTDVAGQIGTALGATFSSQEQAYTIPCNVTPPDLAFVFGNGSFTVPGADLVVKQQGACVVAIIPGDLGGGLVSSSGDWM